MNAFFKMPWRTKSDKYQVHRGEFFLTESYLMKDHAGCSLLKFPYSSVTISFGFLIIENFENISITAKH